MVFSRRSTHYSMPVTVTGQSLEEVSSFTYLGSMVDVRARIGKPAFQRDLEIHQVEDL